MLTCLFESGDVVGAPRQEWDQRRGGKCGGGDDLWRKAAWASAFFFLRSAISETRAPGSSMSALQSDLSSGGDSSLFGMGGGEELSDELVRRRRFKMA